MEFDKNTINLFLSLDDDSLRQKIQAMLIASGADAHHAERATRDVKKMRRKLEEVSETDIRKLIDRLGPDVIQQISDQIKKSF